MMTNDKNSKCGSSPTHQCGTGAFKKIHLYCEGRRTIGRTVRRLWTAGIPVHRTGAKIKSSVASSREKNSFYSQASIKARMSFKTISKIQGRIFKCYAYTCFRTLSQKSKEWLIGAVVINKFVCSICLTDWEVRSCLTPIIFWFQRKIFMIRTQHA